MAKVATVALVVHGVGDHTPADILGEAQKGFHASVGPTGEFETLELPAFPQLDGTAQNQVALRVKIPNSEHLVIPLVWSGVHPRAVETPERRIVFDLTKLISPNAWRLAADAFHCVGKAKSRWWRIAVLAAALFLSLTLVGLSAALILLFVGTLNYVGLRGPFGRSANMIVALLFLGFMAFLLKQLLPAVDFPGDVAFYVGREDKRAQLESHLLAILESTAALMPGARILFVGHSLGSVLVANTYLKIACDCSLRERIVLVTLGSPLALLSRVFSGIIPRPEDVACSRPLFWANLWRDRDYIGRALRPQDNDHFAERSLGDGGHANYWGDSRLWRVMYDLLLALNNSRMGELKRSWTNEQRA
jgi:hypothetical protein